ncbi:WD repeat-containing protein 74-like [Capsicum chacoense]
MPRTITVESSGCPPLRALTFDILGLIKVIEAKGEQKEAPKVVERWGEPDASRCVLATSLVDREFDPLLGVARKNGKIEVLSPVNGDVRASISIESQNHTGSEDNSVVGLHLFRRERLGSSSRSYNLLTCTNEGQASLKYVKMSKSLEDSGGEGAQTTWNVCGSGSILFSKVDADENHALFGGKGVEVNVFDLNQCDKESVKPFWSAKSPAKNSLGIFTPTWFTCATFLCKDDHRKFVAGTNSHQVRLYDISAQRRPVVSFDFRETPIKAVAEDVDGHTIYVGNGSGDLASFDIRTGKLLGSFLGKCSGSIRSIVRHPELPVIASCGLDSYLRIWDVKSRQLLSAVFLKQHLSSVVFDSKFSTRDSPVPTQQQDTDETLQTEEDEGKAVKRKKASKDHSGSKKPKTKKKSKRSKGDSSD